MKSAKTGKAVPLDVGFRADGNIALTEDLLGESSAHYVPVGQGERVSHFATCPNAAQHRRKP